MATYIVQNSCNCPEITYSIDVTPSNCDNPSGQVNITSITNSSGGNISLTSLPFGSGSVSIPHNLGHCPDLQVMYSVPCSSSGCTDCDLGICECIPDCVEGESCTPSNPCLTPGTFNASCQCTGIGPCNQTPTISCPNDITGTAGQPVNFVVTSTEPCSGVSLTPVCSHTSGSTFSIGTTTVNCVTTSTCNTDTNSCSFDIIIPDPCEGGCATCESCQGNNGCQPVSCPSGTLCCDDECLQPCLSTTVGDCCCGGNKVTKTISCSNSLYNNSNCSCCDTPLNITCTNNTFNIGSTGTVTVPHATLYNATGCEPSTTGQSSFNCNDLGNNNVNVTVTDAYNNMQSCTSVVTITDTNNECTSCTDSVTNFVGVNLTGHGCVSGGFEIDLQGNMGFSNCPGSCCDDVEVKVKLEVIRPDNSIYSPPQWQNVSIFCGDLSNIDTRAGNGYCEPGTYTFKITVLDVLGSMPGCTLNVSTGNTFQDSIVINNTDACCCGNVGVTCIGDLSVTILSNGLRSINHNDLISSTSGCGTTVISGTTVLDCDDVGNVIPITVTVEDDDNNQASCTVNVTVVDLNGFCVDCPTLGLNIGDPCTPTDLCQLKPTVQSDCSCSGTTKICDDCNNCVPATGLCDSSGCPVGSECCSNNCVVSPINCENSTFPCTQCPFGYVVDPSNPALCIYNCQT